MKQVTLSEILTPAQLVEVEKIINDGKPGTWNRLREYLVTQRESLEAKEVLPEYLAYFLEYEITKG